MQRQLTLESFMDSVNLGFPGTTGLTLEESSKFINAYLGLYHGVKRYRDKVIEEAKSVWVCTNTFQQKTVCS